MSVFKKNIIASYTAQMVSVICNFCCSVLAARMLGTAGQGELALYVSFAAFITILIGLGLPSAVVYFLAGKKIQKGKVIPIVISVTLLMLLTFAMFYFIAREMNILDVFLPDFIFKQTTWSYVLMVHLLILMMNQYFNSLLQAENKFIRSAILTGTGSVLLLLMYSLKYFNLVQYDVLPIYWIIGSILVVAGFQYFIYLISIYKLDKTYFSFQSFSVKEIKPLFWFAGIAYIANVVQFLNYRMDLWFINYFHHSDEMIGVYSLAATLSQLVWHLPTAVHGVLYTFSSSGNEPALKISKTAKTSRWLLLYAIAAGISGYLLSIWLVPLWFGEEFAGVSQLIGILLFGIVPFCYGIGVSAYFAGIHKVHINMFGSLIGLAFCIVFDILLIPKYGMEGAAYASVISYISTVGFYYYHFRKHVSKK